MCCTGAGTGTCTAFPTLNAYQSTNNAATAANGGGGGVANAFVAKLNPSASGAASLLYSTYLGGSAGYSGDWGNGIAVDSSGNAYVTGATGSFGNSSCNGLDTPGACCTGAGTGTCIAFPTLNAFQSTLNGGENAFVAKLDPSASGAASLLYSTYLGGSTADVGFGIAADPSGNAYVTGTTESNDFPTLNAYQSTLGGEYSNAFVAKLNPGLSGMASLLYSTYLGGDYYDMGYGIAVDSSANAYVTGSAASTNFPTLNAYQSTNNDTEYGNAFVAKLNPAASGAASLLYSTYLGGTMGRWLRHRGRFLCQRLCHRNYGIVRELQLHSFWRTRRLLYGGGNRHVHCLPDPECLPEHQQRRRERRRRRKRVRCQTQPIGVGSGVAELFDLPRRQRHEIPSRPRLWHRARFLRQRLCHGIYRFDQLPDPECLPEHA